ncbi:ABC transporter ATP-binding protein [Rhizobium leguminosarum]|uniref:ABC transporter ATP-binding protein n=1 Tax=Rhizobium leguminosarum TaxID=384 RepID=UPI000DDAB284|nr:ABC transporter ATP-binding protein [Rhizobium leguminosarum]MBY5494245.1 ABC transporter ATP-binding protein [Rhizobium leguminosarum]NKK46894.1 ATP-binding cassette domain-containing protein [Rhizobium leguminosarum bv. viciae]TBZ40463.1 ABC transporter ATP-binding protein [Rhizobium leguminosarum bv. viciae]TCA06439.1 ABC transporter ATP-binding protein [Rhizobium leguminosarum bv. viciae]TCA19647.1 ABC transporter ATP-binding protein [Rhizobium leguminosarum bv. viciae]
MLSINDVTSGYGSTMVLRNLGLEVPAGKVTAIVGRNGSGKTTLIRTIMGYNRLKSGTIFFSGQRIDALSTAHRARAGIGYVPQGRHIFPDLTVAENLQMGLSVGSDNRQRQLLIDQVYELFPILEERRNQKGGTMSGGQQQMAAIGRALVGNPDLLLLDEPSEGIQPSIVGEIERHILRFKENLGLTILIAEQDVHLIKAVADICHVLERGQVIDSLERSQFENSGELEKRLQL